MLFQKALDLELWQDVNRTVQNSQARAAHLRDEFQLRAKVVKEMVPWERLQDSASSANVLQGMTQGEIRHVILAGTRPAAWREFYTEWLTEKIREAIRFQWKNMNGVAFSVRPSHAGIWEEEEMKFAEELFAKPFETFTSARHIWKLTPSRRGIQEDDYLEPGDKHPENRVIGTVGFALRELTGLEGRPLDEYLPRVNPDVPWSQQDCELLGFRFREWAMRNLRNRSRRKQNRG